MLRFGRKVPLPSTAQIKHEMRLMGAADALIKEARSMFEGAILSRQQITELVGELGSKHGISPEVSEALVNSVAKRTPAKNVPKLA